MDDRFRGAALLESILSVPTRDRDAWVDELLGIDPPPPDVADLPRGAVPYLPCEVDEVLAMVRAVSIAPEDTFVDLGSGLGRVVMLAHLLTGARAMGIEIQEPLVASARSRCADLGLTDVSFTCANAAETALEGSIFFLYAPFNGPMLTATLGQIEKVAQRGAIVVAAVDVHLDNIRWLRRRKSSPTLSLAIYDSFRV